MQELPGFDVFVWEYEGSAKAVYTIGDLSNPPVLLMHELPGMVPETVELARELSEQNFFVYMPLLLGQPNQKAPLSNLARVCLSREFSLLAKSQSSPVTQWLRSLCREAHRRSGGLSVGAIGMCLTGGFALSLMVEESVMAPVLSQPSLPVLKGGDLGISPHELEAAKRRSQEQNIPVLGLRFRCDILCRRSRFQALEKAFGSRFRKIEIPSHPFNPHGLPLWSHSVLTLHRTKREEHPTQQAYRAVVAFLEEQLR